MNKSPEVGDVFNLPLSPEIRQDSYSFVKENPAIARQTAEIEYLKGLIANKAKSDVEKANEAICLHVIQNGDMVSDLRHNTGIDLGGALEGGSSAGRRDWSQNTEDSDIADIAYEMDVAMMTRKAA